MPDQSNIIDIARILFTSWMYVLLRLSLGLILSGLLFSPAEGVCLLPFTTDKPESEYQANTGNIRYQESVFRIEKSRNDRVPGGSEKRSIPFLIDGSVIGLGHSSTVLTGPFPKTALSLHHEQESLHFALTIRPPPVQFDMNAL